MLPADLIVLAAARRGRRPLSAASVSSNPKVPRNLSTPTDPLTTYAEPSTNPKESTSDSADTNEHGTTSTQSNVQNNNDDDKDSVSNIRRTRRQQQQPPDPKGMDSAGKIDDKNSISSIDVEALLSSYSTQSTGNGDGLPGNHRRRYLPGTSRGMFTFGELYDGNSSTSASEVREVNRWSAASSDLHVGVGGASTEDVAERPLSPSPRRKYVTRLNGK